MIEVKVPKDIRKYQTKIVGPFTGRNVIGLAIGLAGGGLIYTLCKGAVSDVKIFGAMVGAIPGIAIGWINLHGMPFEQYAKIAFVNTFLIPRKIVYKTNNIFDVKEPVDPKAQKKKKKYVCKNPEFKKYT